MPADRAPLPDRAPSRPFRVALALVALSGCQRAQPAPVTYSHDIAPIVLRRCAPCHRPGEVGPFPLLRYEDVAKRARQIARVTRTRFMPPWKPVPGYASYADDRGLAPAEIDLIGRWAASGAPLGNAAEVPPAPEWPRGWRLGEPDLVVELPEAYTLPASGPDEYRCFVIPTPSAQPRHVAAWELRVGNAAVHHAILGIDRLGLARRRDAEDAAPGFASVGLSAAQSPDGFYLVWTPNKSPVAPRPGTSWRLDGRTDLVLELHMQPTGKVEQLRPKLGLYFAKEPPTVPRVTLRLGDPPIDIPAGERAYRAGDELTLPADVELLSVFPHAHYVARKVRAWARLPSGEMRWLVYIDDWDPAWQDEYVFERPLALPRGTTLGMELEYDNSAENERNPNQPPRRVVLGPRTVDEMGSVTLQVVPRSARDADVLRLAKYERHAGASGSATDHYNFANALARLGRGDDAIAAYRSAIERDPRLVSAHYNLGNLLFGRGRTEEAAASYARVLALEPAHVDAQVNLGHARLRLGQVAEARALFERAMKADPRSAEAHAGLGLVLRQQGDARGATAELSAAVERDPDNAALHVELAGLLRGQGATADAIAHYRRALALRQDLAAAREGLAALGAKP